MDQQQENKLLETAIAPIRSEPGTTLGALVVGYDLSNGVARREGAMLDRDIAFLVDGKVYSSSLEGSAARDLRAFLFGPRRRRPTACSAVKAAVSRSGAPRSAAKTTAASPRACR